MRAAGVVSLPVLSEIARLRTRYDFAAGDRALRAGRLEPAATAFTHAAQTSPDPDRRYEAHRLAAEVFRSLGRPADQLAHLRAMVALRPQETAAWRALATTLQTQADDGAVEAWNGLLAADASDSEAHDALVGLHSARGDLTAAAEHARALADASPTDPAHRSRLARLLDQAGDADGAIEAWSAVVAIDPADLTAHARLANLFTAAARSNDALIHLRAIAEAANTAPAWVALARALREAGDLEAAEAAWRRLLAVPKGEAQAHAELAGLLFDQGRHAEAIPHLRYSAEREGQRLKPWKRLAQSSKAAGDSEGAVEAWRKVLEIGGANGEAHNNLSALLYGLSRTVEALPHFQALTQEAPDNAVPWMRLSQVQQELGDREAALAALRAALAAAPDDRSIHEALVALLNELDRRGEALAHLRRIAELSPAEAKPWRRLAMASRLAKDFDGAVAAWRRLLSIPAAEAEADAALGALLYELGRHAEAAPHLLSTAERERTNLKAWSRLAQSAQQAGDPARAIEAWGRAIEIAPQERAPRDALIALLVAQGRELDALQHSRALAESHPQDLKLWRRLAIAARGAQEREVSIEAWRHVLEIGGADAEAHGHLGDMLFEMRRHEEAAPHLRIQAQAQPDRLKPWKRLADTLQRLEDFAGAAEAVEAILRLGDDPAERQRLVELLLKAGRPQEAVDQLRLVVQADPENLKNQRNLARLLQTMDDASAVDVWREVLRLDPKDTEANLAVAAFLQASGQAKEAIPYQREAAFGSGDAKAIRRFARAAQDLGDIDEAKAAWSHILSLAPGDAEAHQQLAGLAQAAGDDEEAAFHLQWVAQNKATDERLWRRVAKAYTRLKRGDEAAAAWERIFEIAPNELERRKTLADLFEQTEDYAKAEPHLLWLTDNDDGDRAAAWSRLARNRSRMDDAEGEIAAWRELLVINPDDADAHNRLAALYKQQGDLATAASFLRGLAQHAPTNVRPWKRLANLYAEAGDAPAEVEVWRTVLALNPNDGEGQTRLAELLTDLYLPAQALPHLQAIAEKSPDVAKHWQRVARAVQKSRSPQDAITAWQRVLDLRPDDLEAHENMVRLLDQVGRSADATPHLRLLADAGPRRLELWRRLAPVGQDVEAEIAWWKRVLALTPDDRSLLERLSLFLYGLGRKAEALPYFRELARLAPEDALVWRRLARCLEETGDAAGAREAWGMVSMVSGEEAKATVRRVRA